MNSSKNYSFVVYVKCNQSVQRAAAIPQIILEEPCNYAVLIESRSGCPVFTISMVVAFIQANVPFFAMCFIVFGLALGVFGRSMWKTMIFAIVAFTGIVLSMVGNYKTVDLPVRAGSPAGHFTMAIVAMLRALHCLRHHCGLSCGSL